MAFQKSQDSTAVGQERPGQERPGSGGTALLEEIKAQLEQSFDAIREPMAVIDSGFRLLRANRPFAEAMGQDVVHVPGQLCHALRATSRHRYPQGDGGVCVGCPAHGAPSPGVSAPGVYASDSVGHATLTDATGRRWAVTTYPVDIPGSPGSRVVHYRDLTAEVEQLAKIAHADKLSAVGKLAGAIAHELNSPMTSVMVFSEAIVRKTEAGSALHEHATEINTAAHRCRQLIHALLRFARRPRAREASDVSLAQVIEDVRPLVAHRLELARISLRVDLAPDLQPVHGHLADLEHVLVDLLSNAIEACTPGAEIAITARNLPLPGHLEVTVRDTGCGMTPATLKAAFDPFFTTKPSGPAAGLGLTTCEAIVSEMGGAIALHSEQGRGTEVHLTLPTSPNQPEEG